jgi:hypothetical protein
MGLTFNESCGKWRTFARIVTRPEKSVGGFCHSSGVKMTVQIPLHGGQFALIDDDDFELVSQFKWIAATKGGLSYARCRLDGKPFGMHRLILGKPKGPIDHKNGNGLDNRRSNLRLCTHAENMRNRRKMAKCASKFKGVTLHSSGNFRATIYQGGEPLCLGTFTSEEHAARQYDRAARIFFGKFAKTNEMLGLLAS